MIYKSQQDYGTMKGLRRNRRQAGLPGWYHENFKLEIYIWQTLKNIQ
jgi:hypothetical protein